MKYKTLFRLLLKFLGVYLCAVGFLSFGSHVSSLLFADVRWDQIWPHAFYWIYQLAIGAYLFFGGKWLADLAIPSNRPYCHECGYDLTGAIGDVCNECGTPFRTSRAEPINEPPG